MVYNWFYTQVLTHDKQLYSEKIMTNQILHLNLKRKWFDMIKSGEKKEEYREITEFWRRYFHIMPDQYKEVLPFKNKILINIKGRLYPPHSVTICFSNGYSKNRKQIFVKCNDVKIDYGYEKWGAEKNIIYYVLSLGDLISTN